MKETTWQQDAAKVLNRLEELESEPPVRSSEIVSLRGYSVPDDAKRKLVDLWLDHDGNDAKQILEAFRLGFNTGATAQANEKLTHSPPP